MGRISWWPEAMSDKSWAEGPEVKHIHEEIATSALPARRTTWVSAALAHEVPVQPASGSLKRLMLGLSRDGARRMREGGRHRPGHRTGREDVEGLGGRCGGSLFFLLLDTAAPNKSLHPRMAAADYAKQCKDKGFLFAPSDSLLPSSSNCNAGLPQEILASVSRRGLPGHQFSHMPQAKKGKKRRTHWSLTAVRKNPGQFPMSHDEPHPESDAVILGGSVLLEPRRDLRLLSLAKHLHGKERR